MKFKILDENLQSVVFRPSEIEGINKCSVLLSCLKDVQKSTGIVDKLPDNKEKVIANFVYSHVYSGLYLIMYSLCEVRVGEIVINEKKINEGFIVSLYKMYAKHIIDIDHINFKSKEFSELINLSTTISKIFILPLFNFVSSESIHFIVSQNINFKNSILYFDLSVISDLRYRVSLIDKNDDIIITKVSDLSVFEFLEKMSKIALPYYSSFVLLYGLRKQDNYEELDFSTVNQQNDLKLREEVYQTTIEIIKKKGGRVVNLSDISQLEDLLIKGNEGIQIQILTHFHYDRLFMSNLQSIRYKQIENLIIKLDNVNQLRDDITFDIIACSSFNSFKKLYKTKVKYIFSGYHDLSNSLAAFMLYEFYTGVNASILNWNTDYLNGNSYIHEAWSNVTRCFYTMMNKYNQISIL